MYSRVHDGVMEIDKYFWKGKDCVGNNSVTKHKKMVAALRQLSLGIYSEPLMEFTRLSESTPHEF